MKTWTDYKEYAKAGDPEAEKEIDKAERLASVVGAVAARRKALGISQRELASICGIPQSTVARIESYKTMPNLDTLLKIMRPLGLKLTVSEVSD